MRRDPAALTPEDRFDVCIVGAGPAGISCALALARAGRRVALIEGGGEAYADWSQDLYRGEVVGDPYFPLDACRLRYLGGTSNHWAGWCRPLELVDFRPNPAFPATGWPIGRAALDPYLAPASAILEIPPVPEDRPLPGGELREFAYVHSPPVRFAEKFGARLEAAPNIALVTEAGLLRLETDGQAITGARVRARSGPERLVRARAYVLATGGIENSRLLLWSNARSGGQVVKRPETLGRFWMERPHFTIGEVIATGSLGARLEAGEGPIHLAPTAAAMVEHGILNCELRLEAQPYAGTKRLIADIACVAPHWAQWAARQLDRALICGALLHATWEQAPDPENRVVLGSERDALGVPRPRLIWRKSAADRRTVRVAAELLGAQLAASDTGRVRLRPFLVGEGDFPEGGRLAGYHHMGGTRMAESPETGVVNRDGKVFGQANLYVAGSSVFPTSGFAPPTLTIVQLALRLADHLNARL